MVMAAVYQLDMEQDKRFLKLRRKVKLENGEQDITVYNSLSIRTQSHKKRLTLVKSTHRSTASRTSQNFQPHLCALSVLFTKVSSTIFLSFSGPGQRTQGCSTTESFVFFLF